MILDLSKSQMLQHWRTCAGLEPSDSDCSVVRFDGIDIDRMLSDAVRRWYLALLDDGDVTLLGPPSDISSTSLVSLVPDPSGYSATLLAAPEVRRICSVRLSAWRTSAAVVGSDDVSTLLPRQANPFSRAGLCSPLAWRDNCSVVHLIPWQPGDSLAEVMAFVDSGPETYRVDERALATVSSHLPPLFALNN